MSLWSPRCSRPPGRDLWHRGLGEKRTSGKKSCAKQLQTSWPRLRLLSLHLLHGQPALVNAPSPSSVHLHRLESSLCAAKMLRGARRVAAQPVDAARRAAARRSLSSSLLPCARLLRTAAWRADPAAALLPPGHLFHTFSRCHKNVSRSPEIAQMAREDRGSAV